MVSILGGWYWGEGIKTQAENTETQNNPKIPQSRRKLAWCQIQVLHSEKIPSIDILYIYTQYIIATAMPHGFSNRHRESCWYSTAVLTWFDMFWHLNPALPLLCFHTFNFLHIFTFCIFLHVLPTGASKKTGGPLTERADASPKAPRAVV